LTITLHATFLAALNALPLPTAQSLLKLIATDTTADTDTTVDKYTFVSTSPEEYYSDALANHNVTTTVVYDHERKEFGAS